MAANVFKLVGDVAVDNSDAMRELEETEDKAQSTASGMKRKFAAVGRKIGTAIKAGVAVGTAALTGLGVTGTREFTKFQADMNEVYTLMPNASEEMKEKLSGDIKDLGEQYGYLTEDTVPALYQAISAGVPEENVMTFMETAAKSAKAGATDLQTSVDGLSSAVNSYGSDVLSAERASDIMFTTVKEGKTRYAELAKNMSNVTPIASTLGISFADINAALATMTKQGMDTGKASIYIRSMLNQLSKEGTEANQVFKDIAGVGFQEFIAQGNDLGDAMNLLESYAESNNTTVKKLFGNIRAGTGAMMLTGKQSKEFRKNIDAMGNSAGSTDTAYQEMTDTIQHQFSRLQSWWQNTQIAIGGALEDDIKGFIDWLQNNKGQIRNTLVAMFEGISDAIGAVVEFVPKAVQKVKNFSQSVQNFWNNLPDGVKTTLKQIGKSIGAIASALAITVGGMALWSAISAFGGALATIVSGPAAVIAGITAALTAGQKIWNKFFSGLTPYIKEFAKVLGGSGLSAIKDTISALMSGDLSEIPGIWEDAFKKIKQKVVEIWPDVKSEAKKGLRQMWQAMKGYLKGLVRKFSEHFPDLAALIKDHAPGLTKAFNELVEAGKGLAHQFKTKIFQPVKEIIGKLFSGLAGDAEGSPINRIQVFKDMVKTQLDLALDIIEGILKQIKNLFKLGEAVFSGDWKTAIQAVKDIAETNLELVKDAVDAVISQIINILKLAGVWDEIKGAYDQVVTNIENRLVQPIKEIPGKMKQLGKDIIGGIWNGIKSKGTWFKELWNKWVDNHVPGLFKGMLKIGSPSKRMRRLAYGIPQGIAKGIQDGTPLVKDAMGDLTHEVEEGEEDMEDSVDAGEKILKQYEEALEEAKETAKELGDESFTTSDKIDLLREYLQKMIDAGVKPGNEALQELISRLDETGDKAEDAGEKSSGAFSDLGSDLQSEAGNIATTWIGALDKIMNKGVSASEAISSAFRSTGKILGRVIGSQFGMPGVGGAIGGLIGGFIGNLFGPSERQKWINETSKNLKESLTSSIQSAFNADTYEGFLKDFGSSFESMMKSKLIKALMTRGAMKEQIKKLSDFMAEAVVDSKITDKEERQIQQRYENLTDKLKPIFKTIQGLSFTGQGEESAAKSVLPSGVRASLSKLRGAFGQMTSPGSAAGESLAASERSQLKDFLSQLNQNQNVDISIEDVKIRSEEDIERLAQRLKQMFDEDTADSGQLAGATV